MKKNMKTILKKAFISEPRSNPNKERDIAILVIGFIIMIILFIFLRNGYIESRKIKKDNQQTNIEPIKEESNSLEKQFNKYKDNYDYKIIINNNNSYIYFDGKVSKNINYGVKTIDAKKIEYEINSNSVIDINTKEEINNLYEGLLYYFFIPSNIYNFIKDIDVFVQDDPNNYTYDTIYNDKSINIKISIDNNKMIIKYTYDNIFYSIDFISNDLE